MNDQMLCITTGGFISNFVIKILLEKLKRLIAKFNNESPFYQFPQHISEFASV